MKNNRMYGVIATVLCVVQLLHLYTFFQFDYSSFSLELFISEALIQFVLFILFITLLVVIFVRHKKKPSTVSFKVEEISKPTEKKEAQTSKEVLFSTTAFNKLEEELLSTTTMTVLYETACAWMFEHFHVTYVGFSNINENKKLSIEFYKEKVPSEDLLIQAVSERTENFDDNSIIFLIHHDHTVSIPFTRKGITIGFIFLGIDHGCKDYSEWGFNPIVPFIRIFNTACLVIELAKTKEQRSSLQKAFSSYVPSAIVNSFEHDPSVLRIGGDYEDLSIMFTDLRGFTTLSQDMSPDNLITVLNEYFSEMSGVIEMFGGTVSKLVGDGILAFFRPGDTGGLHVEKCCEAALTIKKYETILNSKLIGMGKIEKPLFTRIGISTGKVILGNVGSEKRLDYTVMGSEVNLASRIEEANKQCGTSILVSHETYLKVNESFDCRNVAFIKLKGFSNAVHLYELVSKLDDSSVKVPVSASLYSDIEDIEETLTVNNFVEELDAIEDVESIDEAEELDAIEDAESIDEVEELEAIEDAESIDEAEELEAIEDAESIDDAEELEAIEDAESIDEAEELEVIDDTESIEELEAKSCAKIISDKDIVLAEELCMIELLEDFEDDNDMAFDNIELEAEIPCLELIENASDDDFDAIGEVEDVETKTISYN